MNKVILILYLLVPRPKADHESKNTDVLVLVPVENVKLETTSLTTREITNDKPIRKHRRSRGKFSRQNQSR